MTARGNIEAIYPLTPVQDGILFHTLYAPDSPLYFQQYSCVVTGDMDVDLFRRSWDVVVDRHQALRSLLTWDRREQPLQIVRAKVDVEWRIDDWRGRDDQPELLSTFLEEDRGRGFDLAVAPLMRCALFRIDDRSHRFVWSHHHVIIDGWSMGIVLDEVFRAYEALSAGQDPELPEPADYRRYIAWLQGRHDDGAERYWTDVLAGFTVATPLRIDKSAMPSPWAERHAEEIVRLPADRTAQLAAMARRNGLTLNTMLQGAWALLLSRYSGEADLVFGATTAGRPPDLDGAMAMVGMFLNTLPVRIGIDGGAQLVDWLHAIQDQQQAAGAYAATPLVDVQGWSEVPKGDPLFSTLLVFENVPVPEAPGGRLRTSDIRYLQRSNYPLAVLVMPGDEMELILLYDADRFDADVVARMARQLAHVLEVMTEDLHVPVGEVDVLPPAELAELMLDWNDTASEYPHERTMDDLIVESARAAPERVAVTDGDVTLTYGQLLDKSSAIAVRLRRAGVVPNSPVGVCMERSPAMVAAILGVMRAGGAYVPMDPAQPQNRRNYVLEDTGAVALIVGVGWDEPGGDMPLVRVAASGAVVADDDGGPAIVAPPEASSGPGDLAYVLFTSGSTGRPKGVAVSHHNLVNSTHARRSVYPGRVGSFLLVSPFIFDSSLVGLFWTLYDTGTIVLPAPQMEQDVRHLAALVNDHQVTHLLALPTLYNLTLEHAAPGELDALRVVMVAGEACPPAVAERHHASLPNALLVNEYGPTEATVWCSAHTISNDEVGRDDAAQRRVPIGRPIPNTQIFVLDGDMRPAPVGVPGELCVAGDGLSAGYLNHPELTAEAFVHTQLPHRGTVRVYRTGDVARFLPGGVLDLVGRVDHQVKIRGQRIELSEIEMALRQYAGVRDAAVVLHDGTSDDDAGRRPPMLVAYAETSAPPEELRSFLAGRLPDVMVPALIVPLEDLPHGATGKVDRNALPAPVIADAVDDGSAVLPQDETQGTLAAIWAEVLGVAQVGVTDNFFELGGDSILSIRIIARAHEAGLSITPRQFFELPTVAELAAAIGAAQ